MTLAQGHRARWWHTGVEPALHLLGDPFLPRLTSSTCGQCVFHTARAEARLQVAGPSLDGAVTCPSPPWGAPSLESQHLQ